MSKRDYIFLLSRAEISEAFWKMGIDCADDTSDDDFIKTKSRWWKLGYRVIESEIDNFVLIPTRCRNPATLYKTTIVKYWKFYHLRQCEQVPGKENKLTEILIAKEKRQRKAEVAAVNAASRDLDRAGSGAPGGGPA